MVKRKTYFGLLFGLVAGFIDVIPMIIQKITLDAIISAFLFWIIVGFFISTTNINLKGMIKGIFISFLLLIPTAIIISWQNPLNLIPIGIMTLILGSILGFLIDKINKK